MKTFELIVTVEDLKHPYLNITSCPIAQALKRRISMSKQTINYISVGSGFANLDDSGRGFTWSNEEDLIVAASANGKGKEDLVITVTDHRE